MDAVVATHKLVNTGHREMVDADLSGCFDSISHEPLLKSMARRVSDESMLHLIKLWLQMPVEDEDDRGRRHRTTRNKDEKRGTPQGAPISPLFSNLYMRRFILGWKRLGYERKYGARIGELRGRLCARQCVHEMGVAPRSRPAEAGCKPP